MRWQRPRRSPSANREAGSIGDALQLSRIIPDHLHLFFGGDADPGVGHDRDGGYAVRANKPAQEGKQDRLALAGVHDFSQGLGDNGDLNVPVRHPHQEHRIKAATIGELPPPLGEGQLDHGAQVGGHRVHGGVVGHPAFHCGLPLRQNSVVTSVGWSSLRWVRIPMRKAMRAA